jgi:hypothetical protein
VDLESVADHSIDPISNVLKWILLLVAIAFPRSSNNTQNFRFRKPLTDKRTLSTDDYNINTCGGH